MTIQRSYRLPNCTLIVEGLSETTFGAESDVRPLLSILVNAECHLAASPPLVGGREFLESLLSAVSVYAQEFLSHVHHPDNDKQYSGLVRLQKVNDRHRLSVQPENSGEEPAADSNASNGVRQIDLTTVQLFDLVEAVDQFFADRQTLPELSLQIVPVAKRHNGSGQQLAKQAVPATVGVSSLALVAIAFFFVPIPEVQRPVQPKPQSNSSHSGNLAIRNPHTLYDYS